MSEREQAKMIIDALPEYKLSKLLMFLQGIAFDNEIEDDEFCEQILQDYLDDSEKGDYVPFDEVLRDCGVSAGEL